MAAEDLQGELVASYSWKAYLIMPLALLPIFLFPYFWYLALSDRKWFFNGALKPYFLIVGSAALLFWIPMVVWFCRQVLLKGRRAVWIENNCVIYMSPRILNVPCADIVKVTVDEYEGAGITLLLRDGAKKVIPASLLSSPAETVLNRLKTICHQF